MQKRKVREKAKKMFRTSLLYFFVTDSLLFCLRPSLFSFTNTILYPPLLSEAVTPARCTSLTPHAAFLSSPPRSHWLSDSEQRAADWSWGPAEKGTSRKGRGISGLMLSCGHSCVNFCTAQCGSAQHRTERRMNTRIWVGLLHCCGSPPE